MEDVYVVYWSSTGNTQAMAEAVGEGIVSAGKNARVVEVASMDAEKLKDVSGFALGCPATGAEELDEEMDTFVAAVEPLVSGKTVALFGSYDWGDGTWMRDWAKRMEDAGATVIGGEEAIANLEPDEDMLAACRALGGQLAK